MTSFGLETLDEATCRDLLAQGAGGKRIGRIAVKVGTQPAVLPVVYGLLDDDVVFRTDPGTKLIAAVLHTVVAFEIDDFDPDAGTGWDVNVVGHAEEIRDRPVIERADALGLPSWAGGVRDRWVRIRAEHVTGRRLVPDGDA